MNQRSAAWQDAVRVGRCRFGRGVFAVRPFRAGQHIAAVDGRIVHTYDPRREEFYLDFGDGVMLEPYAPFRYLNHSCEPNCALELEEGRNGTRRLRARALRAIGVGEELHNDYAWPAEDPVPCLCGSRRCRGWIVAASKRRAIDRAPVFRAFPAEFADILSRRGRAFLADGSRPAAPRPGTVCIFHDLVAPRVAREAALLLAACFRPLMKRLCVPIPAESISGMKESYGELLEKTMDVQTTELNGRRSSAVRVAQSIGLLGMLQSDSFHRFAEVASRLPLRRNPDFQLHCYEDGQYTGPHNDHFPEFIDAAEGYVDVQLTFCNKAVKAQQFVYERNRLLTATADVSRSGTINVCHLPFWHYTTPLERHPNQGVARRWVIVASFEIERSRNTIQSPAC